MVGPYKTVDEAIECMLYWQKRALEAEQWLEEEADQNEMYVDLILDERKTHDKMVHKFFEMKTERDYYKQQLLDKQNELGYLLGYKTAVEIPEEESDDPWKYRSGLVSDKKSDSVNLKIRSRKKGKPSSFVSETLIDE